MRFQEPANPLRLSALLFISLILAACGSGDGPDKIEPSEEEVEAREKVVVFRDDFGGPVAAGRAESTVAKIPPAPLEGGNWVAETGYGDNGWGNDEWQQYTNSMDNLFTENGSLIIRASCATAPACGKRDGSITSARIITKDRLNVRYGAIRARIKMPSGLGMWPAFWTLGSDIDERPWPDAGEIDIVEMHYFYSDQYTTHFSTHYAGPPIESDCSSGVPSFLNAGEVENCVTANKEFDYRLTDDFHIYELEWTESQIFGKIDGITYFVQAIDPDTMEEFLKDHFLLLNVAVGGTLGGPIGPQMSADDWADPDQTDMLVDWVEVLEFVQPTPSTLIDEEANNIPYGEIRNSVNFGGANVLADDESTEYPALVGDTVLQLDFSNSVSLSVGASGRG